MQFTRNFLSSSSSSSLLLFLWITLLLLLSESINGLIIQKSLKVNGIGNGIGNIKRNRVTVDNDPMDRTIAITHNGPIPTDNASNSQSQSSLSSSSSLIAETTTSGVISSVHNNGNQLQIITSVPIIAVMILGLL